MSKEIKKCVYYNHNNGRLRALVPPVQSLQFSAFSANFLAKNGNNLRSPVTTVTHFQKLCCHVGFDDDDDDAEDGDDYGDDNGDEDDDDDGD